MEQFNVGFTGTRKGMTEAQKIKISQWLEKKMKESDLIGHHGDCVGADKDFHYLCRDAGVKNIYGHPPTKNAARAFCDFDAAFKPKPYLVRNKSIVAESDILIAAPDGPETERSGTWSTVRHAKKVDHPVCIIYPTGDIEVFNLKKG